MSAEEQTQIEAFEEVSSEEVVTLKRKHAIAGKGPMNEYFSEQLEIDEDVPDLAGYFMEFDLDFDEQIRCCRAYASYLTSLKPRKKKTKKE